MSAVDRIRKALKASQEEPDTEVPVVVALWPGEAEALCDLADAARRFQRRDAEHPVVAWQDMVAALARLDGEEQT